MEKYIFNVLGWSLILSVVLIISLPLFIDTFKINVINTLTIILTTLICGAAYTFTIYIIHKHKNNRKNEL